MKRINLRPTQPSQKIYFNRIICILSNELKFLVKQIKQRIYKKFKIWVVQKYRVRDCSRRKSISGGHQFQRETLKVHCLSIIRHNRVRLQSWVNTLKLSRNWAAVATCLNISCLRKQQAQIQAWSEVNSKIMCCSKKEGNQRIGANQQLPLSQKNNPRSLSLCVRIHTS